MKCFPVSQESRRKMDQNGVIYIVHFTAFCAVCLFVLQPGTLLSVQAMRHPVKGHTRRFLPGQVDPHGPPSGTK